MALARQGRDVSPRMERDVELDVFLHPKSVAVVGASAREGSVGHETLRERAQKLLGRLDFSAAAPAGSHPQSHELLIGSALEKKLSRR